MTKEQLVKKYENLLKGRVNTMMDLDGLILNRDGNLDTSEVEDLEYEKSNCLADIRIYKQFIKDLKQ